MAYEQRDAEFDTWMDQGDIPLPPDLDARELAIDALRIAFNAGWEARKKAEFSTMYRQ